MKIPKYDTGIEAVQPAFLQKSKFEVVSQYGFTLAGPFETLEEAIEMAHSELKRICAKYPSDSQDKPKFI
jgi:hypothetical protein